MNIPIYDITFDVTKDIGMTAISFVDFPAIETNFVYFSKDGTKHKTNLKNGSIILANAEKHEIISPILIPNQLILRVDEQGQKYYLRWKKEVIEKVANCYLLDQNVNNFTVMHSWFNDDSESNYEDSFIKDVYLKKLWIIKDENSDIINKEYGYHLPEGTLCVHLKIHNRKLWSKIKSGELKGLSIEAFLPSTYSGKITLRKSKTHMNKKFINLKEAFDKFLLAYNKIVDEAEELTDIVENDKTESGEVSLKYYTSDTDFIEIKEGGIAVASDGSTPEDGEYPLADGNLLVIKDGKFVETKPKVEADEEPIEAPIAEEEVKEEDEEIKKEEDKKEEVTEEEVEVDVPFTLVPFEIDGVEYMLPQPVIDYINSLADVSENFRKEIAQIKDRIPSIEPVRNVVKQSAEAVDQKPTFSTLFNALNKKLN